MKKVMFVDDSPFVYETIGSFLEGSEFCIAGYAKNGEEALSMYEEILPDIVTMDIILPGIDGLETSEEILKKWPDAKILMISSLAYSGTILKAQGLGIKTFICKPFKREGLLNALKTCAET